MSSNGTQKVYGLTAAAERVGKHPLTLRNHMGKGDLKPDGQLGKRVAVYFWEDTLCEAYGIPTDGLGERSEVLTTEQAAKYLGLSQPQFRALLYQQGALTRDAQIGNRSIFLRASLDAYLEARDAAETELERDWMGVDEVKTYLDCAHGTVYALAERLGWGTTVANKRRLFSRRDVEAYASERDPASE